MGWTRRARVLAGLVAAQIIIFLISLPGFGIETRTASQYAAWAGPIFLGLTVLVFAIGAASLLGMRGSGRWFGPLAGGQGVAAIVTNVLDFSGVGGPRPPTGPLVLGVVAILVALSEIVLAFGKLSTVPAETSAT